MSDRIATEDYVDAEVAGATGAVDSVNGQTGVVVLDAGDVGADVAGAAATAASGAATALATHDADTTSVHGIANTANLYAAGGTDVAVADGGTGASTAAGARSNLGLGTAAVAATGDFEAAGVVATHAAAGDPHPGYLTTAEGNAAYQAADSDLTAIAALTTTSYGRAFLALADAAAGRTALGLGTAATTAASAYEVAGAAAAAQAASQPLDSDLTALAALTTTSYGRSLLETANAAALRTLAGLGTAATAASGDFQPADSDLSALAALTTTSYGRSLLEAANAAALRTLAGLGTAAVAATGDFEASGAVATHAAAGDPHAGYLTPAEGNAAYQPLDGDLTALAAVVTTAFGRALLALADPADATKFLNGSGAFSVPAGGAADPNLNLFLLLRYR